MIVPVLAALLPTALLIALGTALRRAAPLRGLVGEAFWPQAERLSYFVLLPALFFQGLAAADLTGVPVAALAACLVGPILLVAGLLVLLRPLLGASGPVFTSIFQGGIRFNNYVGLAMAAGLFGPAGLALAAVANLAIVPSVNVLCVLVFARHGAARATPLGALRGALLNPLVLSCLGGGLMQALGLRLPGALDATLRALGAASLPLGLLCVGAAFDLGAVGAGRRAALTSSAAKFLALPLATAAAIRLAGLPPPAATVALLFQSLPTASSSYIMARQLGGDAPLMAGIIALQTLIAAAAIPLLVALLAV